MCDSEVTDCWIEDGRCGCERAGNAQTSMLRPKQRQVIDIGDTNHNKVKRMATLAVERMLFRAQKYTIRRPRS